MAKKNPVGWPKGRPHSKEHNEKIGQSLRASGKSALNNPEITAKGRESQHSDKDSNGKSRCAKRAGKATAGSLGFTSSGKSVMGTYRIHLRWRTPIRDTEARKILDELGYLDAEGVPLPKELRNQN